MPRRRALLAVAVTAVLLGAGVAWVLYGSGWLRAERVTVHGTRALNPDVVRRAAAVPLGSPLASVDTGAVAARLRARLPRIAEVDVTRSWPHTISVTVRERHAQAVLRQAGRYVEVDADGVRFGTLTSRPRGVPLLEVEPDGSAAARRFGADRLRREAVRCVTQLPPAVRADTRSVRVRSYDSITVELTAGRTVVWGSAERGAAKARTLTALMKAEPDADHFDVSAPSAPAASGG
ncbi:FtsQ-type POTRA domain-containing protein [Streptomyces sp. B1866]|uniref:cell division protein FtsQ/DivIB n=1 Tax=Streptomyces sp. B1866 TaxID=3075431 RepID=UPI00288F5375|nr:FtsQ-type POTRA domain-containing protein [Streptomyces sp. B1866]MDT3398760.1 FtsQ-type POTRA domain-containing protein [Streptomyces sp. B1866]